MTREQVFAALEKAKSDVGFDANDKIRQDQAMLSIDVASGFGGSMEAAAKAVKAKVLVIVATQDHTVTPGPAREFAGLLGAPVVELTGRCGHLAPGCEGAKVDAAIREFLAK